MSIKVIKRFKSSLSYVKYVIQYVKIFRPALNPLKDLGLV